MGSSVRTTLLDGSYADWSTSRIKPDKWRPHGIRYRVAWVEKGICRVLFDNHHGKQDHRHTDGNEGPYEFTTVEGLWADFRVEVKKLGGLA